MTAAEGWQILYWAWIGSEVVILFVTRTRSGCGKVRDRGSLLLLWPVIATSLTVGTWFGEGHPHTIFGGAHSVRSASISILMTGLAIRWAAILTLGRSFSANVAIHSSQTLHKTGLFGMVRHPSYSGLLLVFVAIGLHTRNWVGLVILSIPTTAALLYRIHVEESALNEAFGNEYARYSRTTKRLIPFVY